MSNDSVERSQFIGEDHEDFKLQTSKKKYKYNPTDYKFIIIFIYYGVRCTQLLNYLQDE